MLHQSLSNDKGKSVMESIPWTVNAWRKQQRATWVAIRFWVIALLAGVIGFYIPFWLNREHVHKQKLGRRTRYTLSTNDETEGQFTVGLVSFAVASGALIAIIIAVRRHYRCPKCGEVPMGSWVNSGAGYFGVNRGLALFPATCPNCEARLR
jgi:glycerol uptake facilitator-like aquaporin